MNNSDTNINQAPSQLDSLRTAVEKWWPAYDLGGDVFGDGDDELKWYTPEEWAALDSDFNPENAELILKCVCTSLGQALSSVEDITYSSDLDELIKPFGYESYCVDGLYVIFFREIIPIPGSWRRSGEISD